MPRNCDTPGCDRLHPLLADWALAHPAEWERSRQKLNHRSGVPVIGLPASRLRYFRAQHANGEEL